MVMTDTCLQVHIMIRRRALKVVGEGSRAHPNVPPNRLLMCAPPPLPPPGSAPSKRLPRCCLSWRATRACMRACCTTARSRWMRCGCRRRGAPCTALCMMRPRWSCAAGLAWQQQARRSRQRLRRQRQQRRQQRQRRRRQNCGIQNRACCR